MSQKSLFEKFIHIVSLVDYPAPIDIEKRNNPKCKWYLKLSEGLFNFSL
jgi:hypothetical protein